MWTSKALALAPFAFALASGSTNGCGKEQAAPSRADGAPPAPVAASSTPPSDQPPERREPPAADKDPASASLSLQEATQGLEGSGKLLADLDTVAGKITCELYETKAPVTVANFVGLARGLRAWRNAEEKWVKQPAFDDNRFHRVIKKFMIQGGAPRPDGGGDGGYFFPDEIWDGATHDRAGLLCMANSGPNTNSMQFFITDAPCKHLDRRGHTIFGDCKPLAVIRKIASAKTDSKDHPIAPQTIKKVTVRRANPK
jgi:peptidyl-prolyl cis-trans isomerase A (cyclophilin A)